MSGEERNQKILDVFEDAYKNERKLVLRWKFIVEKGREKGLSEHQVTDGLKDLEKLGDVLHDEKERLYYLKKYQNEYREITKAEYPVDTKLHSQNLIRDAIKEENGLLDIETEDFPYLLEHLKTGYPDIHQLYVNLKEFYPKEIDEIKTALDNEVEKTVKEKGFEIINLTKKLVKKLK